MADNNFAKKMLEKYGWKEGNGLGKDEQGMATALKPRLKSGKEGMGYELGKDLTDTWWTKAYSDSLRRVRVSVEEEEEDAEQVTMMRKKKKKHDKDADKDLTDEVPSTMQKMKERMMKANFTSFSKGGTLLTNGEVDMEDSQQHNDSPQRPPEFLSDEELLKACGGRTAHKAARFGLKLNGKLARIAKQEEAQQQSLLRSSSSFIAANSSSFIKSSRSDRDSSDLVDLSLDTEKKRKSILAEEI